jgi:hypothetical protein
MSTPTDQVGPSVPAPLPHRSLFGSAVVAGLVAIGGLLLTIYTQKPGAVVPWALCVLGLSAFAPIIPQVPRLAQVCIVVVIAVALISSSIAVFADPRLLTHTAVRVLRGHDRTASAFTTSIRLAAITAPIPYCNEFQGTGTITAGYQLWIFDRDTDPTAKYYFDAQAVAVGNNWSASDIEIGAGAGATGDRIRVLAVLLPAPFMDWLLSTTSIANGLPSPSLPAGAHIADSAVVTRNSNSRPCTS